MGRRVSGLAAAHAAVDLCCALLLFGRAGESWPMAVLLYNFCAFALQLPLGALCDRRGDPQRTAALGCAAVALAFFLPGGLAAVTAGVGNALFHIGGGVAVLRGSERAGPLGLFVAPGAAGLFLGRTWAGAALPMALAPAGMAACAALLVLAARGERAERSAPPKTHPLPAPAPKPGVTACAGMLAAVVVLRSLAGLLQSFPWKTALALPLLASLVLGKALGGLLCDRMGARWAAGTSLAAAAALFLLSANAACGLAAVLLFNMTMPITLWALARRMPGDEGFAFGLLTFALFVGYLPVQAGLAPALGGGALAAMSALSLALLLPALPRGARP